MRLRQLQALALARSGASRTANEMLEGLVADGHTDEESLGMLGRTHKDLWAERPGTAEGRQHLDRAFQSYLQAHRASGGYWSGINAATTALLRGAGDEAAVLARGVRDELQALVRAQPGRDDAYWLLATLGEAALILRDAAAAGEWYRQAAALGRGRLADLASTRRNARLILRHLEADSAAFDAWFPVPPVVVCVGHLVDRPGRPVPRFPPGLEPAVRQAIDARLRATGVGCGFAAAACGADILFFEALEALGADAHVVLPYNERQFLEDSVDVGAGGDWVARYRRVVARATEVVVASEQRMPEGGASFEYGFRMLDGLASVRADEMDGEPVCLAVWDGRPGDGVGGTAGSVEHWRRAGRRIEIIDLAALLHDHPGVIEVRPPAAPASSTRPAPAAPAFDPQIVGLLFADVQGFSGLTEEELPLFVEHFLGLVAAEMHRLPSPPLLANTWGDGLYFVFQGVRETGGFALALRDAVRATRWRDLGFRHELGLRIGLHAGPAYACVDPVTGRPNYIGVHVSRAARIEPITPPGEVYASQPFAALARAEGAAAFRCSYVGQTPLAKGYGTHPTYVVQRRSRLP